MTDNVATNAEPTEDIGAAIQEGRPNRAARSYRIAVSDESLAFRPVTINDPIPLGRQILEAAGFKHVEHSLVAILPSGDFEDVRLDETFDLRGKGAEQFVVFQSDRNYRLSLNDHELRWGNPVIAGMALYTLANASDEQAVYLDTRGGEDRLIEPSDQVDLTLSGVERFVTAARKYEIIINARPKVVSGRNVTFEQIIQLAFPGSHDPNVVFSMTYRHAASKPPAGELGIGGTVQIKKGTVFNVTRTVQS